MEKMIINNDEDCVLFCNTLQCAINKFVDVNVNNLDLVSRTKFKQWIKNNRSNNSGINNLQHQLAVKDKALKIACERIKNMYEQERQYCTNEIPNFVEVEKGYFVAQAEKELKE